MSNFLMYRGRIANQNIHKREMINGFIIVIHHVNGIKKVNEECVYRRTPSKN